MLPKIGELNGLSEGEIKYRITQSDKYKDVDKEYGVGNEFWTHGSAAIGLLAGLAAIIASVFGDKEVPPNIAKDLTDAEKADLGGTNSGTPGGWGRRMSKMQEIEISTRVIKTNCVKIWENRV